MYRDQIRSFQNNIEELFKDQKDLIIRYEKNEKYWSEKLDDMVSTNKELKDKNNLMMNRLEDAQFELKEALNKVSLKEHENASFRRSLEEKDSTIFEMSHKINLLKGDLEMAKSDIDRGNKRYNDLSRELVETKKSNETLKEQLSKDESFYKAISSKKQDEVNEKLRIISNLESKLGDVKLLFDYKFRFRKLCQKNKQRSKIC